MLEAGVGVSVGMMVGARSVVVAGSAEAARVGKNACVETGSVGPARVILGPVPVISGPVPVISGPVPVISGPAPVLSRLGVMDGS